MPVFLLDDKLAFPPVECAIEGGILAIGGDLSPARLLLAYRQGIFPWYSEGEPIIWWSPDPRFVLFPNELKISRSTRQVLKKRIFNVTFDKNFEEVITQCALVKRRGQKGTWITKEMRDAYIELHKLGYAHSVETWRDGRLVGGLYGVSLGSIFFGESMFTLEDNASKVALVTLVEVLKSKGFKIIDSQVYTEHMARFGAREIPRAEYLKILKECLRDETICGSWSNFLEH